MRALPYLYVIGVFLAGAVTASAHLNYSGKDFGIFTGFELKEVPIAQTALNAAGWADGADDTFAYTHDVTFFKFTLQNTALVTVTVDATNPALMLPGFSLYAGLGNTNPPDNDDSTISMAYLATLPGPAKEGMFNALATWRMGDDNDTTFAQMSTFTYVGHKADGTTANYGAVAGISGDGVADGHVSAAFSLAPGNYTLVVGGATYSATASGSAGFTAKVATVPEPSSGLLLMCGSGTLLGFRRRRSLAAGTRRG